MPTAMILLASEQIWPNLLGYLHFSQQGEKISHIYIFHSEDEPKSVKPAERLQAFFEAYDEEIQVVLSGKQSIEPQNVTAKLREWMNAHGSEFHWIVNVSGGLKLMLPGALNLMPSHPTMQVVYREFVGWFEIKRDEEGQFFSQPFERVPDLSLSDGVPLSVAMTLQSSHIFKLGEIWEHEPLDVVRRNIANEWSWNRTAIEIRFPEATDRVNRGPFLFEHFVARTLDQMGAAQVAVNVETTQGHPGEENDVLCLHHSRLLLFDCKLSTEQQAIEKAGLPQGKLAVITEIHDARQRIRDLGGLNAHGILLRPSRDFDADPTTAQIKKLAQSLGLTIWDRVEMRDFFARLQKLVFGESAPPLPPRLAQSQRLLQEQLALGNPTFASFPAYLARVERRDGGNFANVLAETQAAARHNGHPRWWGHFYRNWLFVTLKKSSAWEEDECTRIVSYLVETYSLLHDQISFDRSRNGDNFHLNLKIKLADKNPSKQIYCDLSQNKFPF